MSRRVCALAPRSATFGMTTFSVGSEPKLRILKFGGTSLADPDRVRVVASIIAEKAKNDPTIAVVSAFGGVTDDLEATSRWAEQDDPQSADTLARIRARHLSAVEALAGDEDATETSASVESHLDRLEELLRGISLVGECTPRTKDSVLAVGERLSSILVAAALRAQGTDAEASDAAKLIITDANFGRAWVDTSATRELVLEHFAKSGPLQVVTGFISGTANGETTTLGRGGSDYTATLLGAMLQAEAVEIWTDVDGVMSADPRIVREAFSLESLSYDELMELSHWGARVMHPEAVQPARESGVPIVILNTLNRDFPGTMVSPDATNRPEFPVRGIAAINDVRPCCVSRGRASKVCRGPPSVSSEHWQGRRSA